jgi:AmmeMemoRadiSam system protein B
MLCLKSPGLQYLQAVPSEDAVAIVVPHAGLMYSGSVAGAVYASIKAPDTFVLLGPNHHGVGEPIALYPGDAWLVPTGTVLIDQKLRSMVMKHTSLAVLDETAHRLEHSLEVQLPFIVETAHEAKILPISLMHISLQTCKIVGSALAAAIKESGYRVTIVASTDMSHYISAEMAQKLDGKAIDRILALDPEGLYATVHADRISMCGVYATTIMLYAARALGAQSARLVRYATSADVSGDYDQVVGYAGLIIT